MPAGSCLYIPAGCAYASLPEVQSRTRRLNLYIQDPALGVQPHVLTFRASANTQVSTMAAIFPANDAIASEDQIIARLAAKAGLSREAFTRKFTRQFGISPHANNVVVHQPGYYYSSTYAIWSSQPPALLPRR